MGIVSIVSVMKQLKHLTCGCWTNRSGRNILRTFQAFQLHNVCNSKFVVSLQACLTTSLPDMFYALAFQYSTMQE